MTSHVLLFLCSAILMVFIANAMIFYILNKEYAPLVKESERNQIVKPQQEKQPFRTKGGNPYDVE